MALMMIPSKTAQITLHDKDYFSVNTMIDNARALMAPGQGRAEIRCPICGGGGWVISRDYNNGETPVAMCDSGCFECWE